MRLLSLTGDLHEPKDLPRGDVPEVVEILEEQAGIFPLL